MARLAFILFAPAVADAGPNICTWGLPGGVNYSWNFGEPCDSCCGRRDDDGVSTNVLCCIGTCQYRDWDHGECSDGRKGWHKFPDDPNKPVPVFVGWQLPSDASDYAMTGEPSYCLAGYPNEKRVALEPCVLKDARTKPQYQFYFEQSYKVLLKDINGLVVSSAGGNLTLSDTDDSFFNITQLNWINKPLEFVDRDSQQSLCVAAGDKPGPVSVFAPSTGPCPKRWTIFEKQKSGLQDIVV